MKHGGNVGYGMHPFQDNVQGELIIYQANYGLCVSVSPVVKGAVCPPRTTARYENGIPSASFGFNERICETKTGSERSVEAIADII